MRCDVASNSTFVYAYGFAEDIDATHALYASLVVQMVKACDAYLATGAHRPTPTITARLNFQLAFGARVGQRLAEAREEAQPGGRQGQGTRAGHRDRPAEQGDRAARPLPGGVEGARHLAGDSGDRRGTRRRPDAPATARGNGPGSAAAPELPGARTPLQR